MVIQRLLSKLHISSILRCGVLLLHPIVYRLIGKISYLSAVWNTVWDDATNSSRI